MALSVLNNIASLAAQDQLTITNGNLQKALFQLSSGSRINTGADDAAGLAIADGLHANITALIQSARNANDGVGELQVADGSLAQVTTLLNRAVTIATEAATGTVSDQQRVALNGEFTAIKAEIDRVGSKTNYNGGQVFTANTLNVFLSDSGSTSNSLIGVTTGLLSSTQLSLGGAQAANSTLTQVAGAAAVAATDILTNAGAITSATVAHSTLTIAGTGPANTDTVTVGATTYTFVTTLTNGGTANQVLVGGTPQQSLINLAAAVNGAAGQAGTEYGNGTVANTAATAVNTSATVDTITASSNGLGAAGGGGTGNFVALVSGTPGDLVAASTTLGGAGGVAGIAGNTVAVGGTTYTFVAALSSKPTANEVLAGSVTVSLANLVLAVNQGTGGGVNYGTGTAANANVAASTLVAGTSVTFTADVAGSAGNGITAIANGNNSFATVDLAGGLDPGAAKVATAGDTITVGTQTYTFVNALSNTPTANQVLVGTTETGSLANLANAVNGGSGSGSTYGTPTTVNTSASAVATASTVVFTALTKGLAGNSIVTAQTGGDNTFPGGTLTNGAAGSINDLLSIADATAALTTINAAIQTVAGLRGSIGATVNRLQSAAGVITNQVQNLTGAEDGVRAADIPSTVATLAKYSILEQTGISALAQANQQQQLVLKLLQ